MRRWRNQFDSDDDITDLFSSLFDPPSSLLPEISISFESRARDIDSPAGWEKGRWDAEIGGEEGWNISEVEATTSWKG